MLYSDCFTATLLLLQFGVSNPDITCFQTGGRYSPAIDIASDLAILYGSGNDFADRAQEWSRRGYSVGMMTGIAWGNYETYFGTSENLKTEEIQTRKDGRLFMHGKSRTVGYNVPTRPYLEFIKSYISPAIDAGITALFLEEPEFWAKSGWSEAFKQEWREHYGEEWLPPDTSLDTQYRASKLKYELYKRALQEVSRFAKSRAQASQREIECHFATHSLLNYAHWGIVSPESAAAMLAEIDGFVAQVWTGTARTPNIYRAIKKERTFETAFLEYGNMAYLGKVLGKKVWFLHDPVEDNPDRSWEDYRRNYQATVVASLLWDSVNRYEVMPWPSRIFSGKYRISDSENGVDSRQGIPSDYASIILNILNALNDMDQDPVKRMNSAEGIGIVVSDTMMFQRADPEPSDPDLGCFFAIALPLVKAGVAVTPITLECLEVENALKNTKVLFLTYEHQKPLKPEYHDFLATWVTQGGVLILVDDGTDSYNKVKEWWNDYGNTENSAYVDLLKRLSPEKEWNQGLTSIGRGFVYFRKEKPSSLQNAADGPERVLSWLKESLQALDSSFEIRNYLGIKRGAYLAMAVMDETFGTEEPQILRGEFIDLWDARLPIVREVTLRPGDRTLLYDVGYAKNRGYTSKVLAAGARIKSQRSDERFMEFILRGPMGTLGHARILLPNSPKKVWTEPEQELLQEFDPDSSTLLIGFRNIAEDLQVKIDW